MFRHDQYELIDFGSGRRLESWGGFRIDRPCPVATDVAQIHPEEWDGVDARYRRTGGEQGRWSLRPGVPHRWQIRHGALRLEIRPTPFGHLGVFPEQAENWDWLTAAVGRVAEPLTLLNLFAYTGGATLAAAAAGARVVHVDAAGNVVAWARRNAALAGLSAAPIRWITEDAMTFVRRETRRGNRYDGVILDPPSYGHGPKGQRWQIERDLPELLAACAALTGGACRLGLLTCHTPQLDARRLVALLHACGDWTGLDAAEAGGLQVPDRDGRRLPSGQVVRWIGGS